MSKGFPQQPSDILMMAMLGTIGPLEFTNAPEMRSVGERDEVSLALDLLARTHGSLIVRGQGLWQALAPSTAGHVLTTQGPGADPIWTPGVGGWALVEAQTFAGAVNHAWLNLQGGYQHQWVLADIKTDGLNREFHARISLDNGDTWKNSGYRGMRRWQNDVGTPGSNTFTGSCMLAGGIGNSDDQSANGVFEIVSDLGRSDTRKQFHGWNTEYNDAGLYYTATYAGSYQASKDPINAVLTFINGSNFWGKISLWRRPLA
ncbi:MAG: hypothetical protein FVQ81_18585 [Candidatus Glassbacteria bacterium]|nr:hypothetical protein [Candidatus Glassbacteria bacterium]